MDAVTHRQVWFDWITPATQDQQNEILGLFRANRSVFPHVRQNALQRRIVAERRLIYFSVYKQKLILTVCFQISIFVAPTAADNVVTIDVSAGEELALNRHANM